MKKTIRYTIFNTKWGYFGLTGIDNALLQTHLPASKRCEIEHNLLKNHTDANFDRTLFRTLQEQIIAYFEGSYVKFNRDIHIELSRFTPFTKKVLSICRDITFGRTVSYGRLAEKAGLPAAGRAVGRVLAKNPTPLLIPCHRVIRSDGQLGGFTATGGIAVKKRLLEMEARLRPRK